MISKRIDRKPENDNYRRLAEYIADADHDGEKSLAVWCAGCWAGDDYELAIREVQCTQTLNVRTQKEKTYHLVVSFRPEDESRLSTESFKQIEQEFADALGFGEFQRHCGVHKNTNNIHMHVAYNMIHPEKLTRHEPFRDYHIRDRVCRDIERRFGLDVDNGVEIKRPNHERLTQKAAQIESHTGQQSFEHYVKERHQPIMSALETTTGWQDLHGLLAGYGMGITPQGNGLAIKDLHGKKTAIKASTFDRSFSLKRLEARFGAYESPGEEAKREAAREYYQSTPLHRTPERGNLYTEYKAGIECRKEQLAAVKNEEESLLEPVCVKWEKKREEIRRMTLPRRSRTRLLKHSRYVEGEQLYAIRKELQDKRDAVKKELPYSSWTEFLRWKASVGDELALAILRSKKEEVAHEGQLPKDRAQIRAQIREHFKEREKAIHDSEAFRERTKRTLTAIAKMERLTAEEKALGPSGSKEKLLFSGLKHRIDSKGVIIFTLLGGGTIRDTGKRVYFSAHDEAVSVAAQKYAAAKWGKRAVMDKNTIQLPEAKIRSKQQSMGR